MQFSLASCLILALGAAAAPLEERATVQTAAVAGPGQNVVAATSAGPDGASGTGFTTDSGPTPAVQQLNAGPPKVSANPKPTKLPSDVSDMIPSDVLDGSRASALASAGAAAAADAMNSDFLQGLGSDLQTCYGTYNDDGSMYAEYYFGMVSPKECDSFCGDWKKAIKGSKSCPKEMWANKGWMSCDFDASGTSEANGYASIYIPHGIDEKSAMDCLGGTYSGSLKSPYGKIGSCGTKYQTTKTYRVY